MLKVKNEITAFVLFVFEDKCDKCSHIYYALPWSIHLFAISVLIL